MRKDIWAVYKQHEQIAKDLSSILSKSLTIDEIFYALFLLLSNSKNLEMLTDLWHVDLDYDQEKNLLLKFDFEILNRKIETSTDILKGDYLFFEKARIKHDNFIWLIHKYDADPFPSNPHAHCLSQNIKLDLSNGKCYRIRDFIDTISKKELLKIRQKFERIFKGPLPELSV